MNKKLILLILCLPLLLMLSLFSVSKTVQLAVSVPVSKIDILGDQIVYLNIDSQDRYFVEYVVYPTNAKNQDVTFKTEKVGTSPLAQVEYIDGYLVATGCGKAKVILTTVDGGFRDSFVVEVTSNSLQGISCLIQSENIYVGKTTRIITSFVPEEITTLLNYTVSNPNVASVSADGVVTGIGKGTTNITVSSKSNPNIFDVVTVNVKNKDIIDFVNDDIVTWSNFGSIDISLDITEACTYSYTALDENGQAVPKSKVNFVWDYTNQNSNKISLNYSFTDETFVGSVNVVVKATTESGYSIEKTCIISRIDQITARFDNESVVGLKVNYQTIIPFFVTPNDANVDYEISLSNDNLSASINTQNKFIEITANKLGKTTITLKVSNKENDAEFVTISKQVVILPTTININQSSKTYGIENVLALGKYEVNGNISNFVFDASYGNATIGEGFLDNIYFWTSSQNVNITKDGILTLLGESSTETVELKAVFESDGFLVQSDVFEVLCVYDGVNVRNYLDLYNATNTNKPKPIILQNNIKDDFAVGVGNNFYKEIETTYDKTYYETTGNIAKAKVKVLVEFKNDVYGNGYSINAHNVAWEQNLQNAGSSAVFNGPLNFVAMSETGGMVSVKAQDNICFAVYENVTIRNIELKGCDLMPDENSKLDLNDLTYTGTTVEVLGDNVNIKYSRLTNGRTVLRAFGDINDANKVINLNVQNCVLGGAREFIARLGSNCFIEGTKQDVAPSLPGDTIKSYPMQKNYANMTDEQKQDYDQKFIKTFVTFKNSVFENAGIFAIGLDTHFSGPALEDGSAFLGGLISDWKDLAKTSYGVKLAFEGDVRLYNWKDLDEVDSSSLIEVLGSTAFSEIKLDIPEMISALHENPEFANVVYTKTENEEIKKYIHAGLAFFGGGKNYCVFDDSNYNTFDLNGYAINLADVNKGILQAAAGQEDFYFMLCDATTLNFLPDTQAQILASGDAYSCIYA